MFSHLLELASIHNGSGYKNLLLAKKMGFDRGPEKLPPVMALLSGNEITNLMPKIFDHLV